MLGMSVQLQPLRSLGALSVTLRDVELNGSRPASLGHNASNIRRSTTSRRTALLLFVSTRKINMCVCVHINTYIHTYIYMLVCRSVDTS